jgi:hypothetical protein
MDRHRRTERETEKWYRKPIIIFVNKESRLKVRLRETGWDGTVWIDLAQDKD